MTKEKIIENFKNKEYNKPHGEAFLGIDLDDLIRSISVDYEKEIEYLENTIEDLEMEISDIQELQAELESGEDW